MGGLLTFRVGNFDTTAEREQFGFSVSNSKLTMRIRMNSVCSQATIILDVS